MFAYANAGTRAATIFDNENLSSAQVKNKQDAKLLFRSPDVDRFLTSFHDETSKKFVTQRYGSFHADTLIMTF